MNVLFVASECAPFVKTGGLADVIGSVPKALSELGTQVRILLPAYPALHSHLQQGDVIQHWPDLFGGPATVVAVRAEQLDLLLLDAPHLYNRVGEIYLDDTGSDWHDNHLRFGALSFVGACIAQSGIAGWKPDLINTHDWQGALLSAYLNGHSPLAEQMGLFPSSDAVPPVVLTVHNIAFQGLFDLQKLLELGIDPALFHPDGVEYYGMFGFLKAGLAFASKITTVSPTYARELLLPEFGMGLDGLLRARQKDVAGILNGIDVNVWNPATDPELSVTYNQQTFHQKSQNRRQVEARFNLEPNSDAPLFCVVSRLTHQKGLDLLLECLPGLVESGARLAVLGAGEVELEREFSQAASHYPGAVGVVIGYDEALSHIMQGGCDAIIIPSRFEPCGLTQLYGLRYGTLPVVSRTGGLADTVIDANEAALAAGCATGFQFTPSDPVALGQTLNRVCALFQDTTSWNALVHNAMGHPVSWEHSAKAYQELYAATLTS